VSSSTLSAIGEILERGGDADDVLRAVVAALVESGGCSWAAISFRDEGELVAGPHAGTLPTGTTTRTPIVYAGAEVGELVTSGRPDDDNALLPHVAELIAVHCLVGWDTGGVPWNPAA